MIKRIGKSRTVQIIVGELAAAYLWLVAKSSRRIVDPIDFYRDINMPVIVAMWHGEHFMAPFINMRKDKVAVLISLHRDGEINARAARRLGIATIRGSGDHGGRFLQKRAVAAYREMVATLEAGTSVAMTADVPKVSRRAGLGIVKLASQTGRPIYPSATVTSRRKELDTWDKSKISLPFGRLVLAHGEPIAVPPDADDETLERCRQKVEDAQNAIIARAYDIADGRAEPRP
ncbi:MAG: lysophospholipid acyltransferase family protein [Pseudomonadota bacterium]